LTTCTDIRTIIDYNDEGDCMSELFIKGRSFLIFGLIAIALISTYFARENRRDEVVIYELAQDAIVDKLMHFAGIPKIASDREINCLSENIYREASNQPIEGMAAVGHVVVNRMESGKFPTSACGVIKQKSGSTCQFSWNCQRNLRKIDYTSDNWRQSYAVAYHLLNESGKLPDPTDKALFYHANYVKPNWKPKLQETKVIGDHIFYKPKDMF